MKRIYNIESIEYESHGVAGNVVLRVSGRVNTGGWGPASLRPLSQTSPNGLRHLEMVAEPPSSGTVITQAFAKKQAALEIDTNGLVGVVVHASTNELSKKYQG